MSANKIDLGFTANIVGKTLVIVDSDCEMHCFDIVECFPVIAGPAGDTGPAGAAGAAGADGAPGAPGATGDVGPAGDPGPAGNTGPVGPSGADGTPGSAGPTGAPGAAGTNGTPGDTGPSGVAGPTGSPGTQGVQGNPGTDGAPGTDGNPGADGTPGSNGAPGAVGPTGPVGPGGDGSIGPTGPAGTPGADGTPGTDKDFFCENADGSVTAITPVLNAATGRQECTIPYKAAACSTDPITVTCSQAGTVVQTTIGSSPENVSAAKLGGGYQIGTGEYGGSGYNALQSVVTNNNTVNVPIPNHTSGCKLFLHATGGQITGTGLPVLKGTTGTAMSVSEATRQDSATDESGANSDIFNYVYCLDGNGNQGGTVDIEFPDLDPFNASDLLMFEWSEVCATNQDMTSADFDLANVYKDSLTLTDPNAPFQTITSGAFASECEALVFKAGRHVSFDQNVSGQNVDFDWSGTNNGQEIYDTVSDSSFVCNGGIGLDLVEDGSHTWSYTANSATAAQAGWDDAALMTMIPLACAGEVVDAIEKIGDCSLQLISDLCDPAQVRCVATIPVQHSLSEGAYAVVTPIIDGQQSGNVTTLIGTSTQTINLNHLVGTISNGQVASCDVCFEVSIKNGAGTVTWPDYDVELKTV